MSFAFNIEQPPRTLRHCADHGLTLRIVCVPCNDTRTLPAAEVCRAFSTWTVEELQRAAVFGCATCRRPVTVQIYGTYWTTHPMQMECWIHDQSGYVRKFGHGMSG